MQNKTIDYQLYDNSTDQLVFINPTKQQIFMIPREESQMFNSNSYNYTGNRPSGYRNDPETQTENNDAIINSMTDPHQLTSYTPTDYIGMSTYSVPTYINEGFSDFIFYNTLTSTNNPLYANPGGNVTNLSVGMQSLRIPSKIFSTILTDPAAITANGGNTTKYNYGNYYLKITPKYIESNISNIAYKEHFQFDKLSDNYLSVPPYTLPEFKRRNIYTCPIADFTGTPWSFESDIAQAGRMLGSVVEIWDSNATNLKQVKVMGENTFSFNSISDFQFVLSPDNFGYDPSTQDITVGDIVRVYPRETYFDTIVVNIVFSNQASSLKNILAYLSNDVARNMKTGVYEIYDDNGVTVDSSGNFNGVVIGSYQIEQYGDYELRKKIK